MGGKGSGPRKQKIPSDLRDEYKRVAETKFPGVRATRVMYFIKGGVEVACLAPVKTSELKRKVVEDGRQMLFEFGDTKV